MPTRKFTLAMGNRASQMVESAGDAIEGGNAVELNIDFDERMQRGDLIRTLRKLERSLMTCKWPPA